MGYKIEEERLVFYTKKFLCLGCMVNILAIYREMYKFEVSEMFSYIEFLLKEGEGVYGKQK